MQIVQNKCIKFRIGLQSVTKITETHYIFMKKSLKGVRFAQRYPEFSLPPGSMLCQVVQNYARQ